MSASPLRIKLSRRKGYRLPEGAINCARPSRWGNPFRVVRHERACWCVERAGVSGHYGCRLTEREATERAVELFREHVRVTTLGARAAAELRGHDLACWCPLPKPGEQDWCHAAVLLGEANK